MAKLRINGDSSGYVDLEAPNAASSSTLDLDQVPQKNAANTFSAVNKFTDSVAIGGTHSPVNNLDVRSTGQAIVRVDGVGLYFNGIKIRNNYSSVQSDWNVGAAGGTSGWGSANGTFIVRDDTTNSTGLEIEQGAGSNTAALHINSSGIVTTPGQPAFYAYALGGGIASSNSYTTPGFDNVSHNIGNHYSTSTVTFTAPVAGYYYFHFTMYWNSTNGYSRMRILKNSSTINHYNIKPGLGGDHSQEISGIISMSANDTVKPQMMSDQSNNYFRALNHTYFEGYLLG